MGSRSVSSRHARPGASPLPPRHPALEALEPRLLLNGTIEGQLWHDLDADGVKHAGEPGLDAWTIELTDLLLGGTTTATTAGGGLYSFDALLPGSYEVRQIDQAGWAQTHPTAPGYHAVELIGDALGIDFGNVQGGSISGVKFNDLDADGVKDAGELGLNGWTMELVDNSTGLVVDTAVTATGAVDGEYAFTDVIPGDYEIREVVKEGWGQTFPAPATYSVSLSSNDNLTNRDFGNSRVTVISGRKFEDLNADGRHDPGEPGLADWKIYVDLDANGQWDPGEKYDLTDSLGNYEITDLSPGSYILAEEPQSGWHQSLPALGWPDGRASVDSAGTQASWYSYKPSISGDGRYVAFESIATNLVAGDSNGDKDIFVHDRQTGLTERVSVSSGGWSQGNDHSYNPSISAGGRYIAYESSADNLVSGDSNYDRDIFVHDRKTGLTERVSVDSTGTQGNGHSFRPSISADGRYVAFYSSASNLVSDDGVTADVFVHDRQTGLTECVSVDSVGTRGYGQSYNPSISGDGRYVVFTSEASNLVSGDTNGDSDIFVHDRDTGLTDRMSVGSAGAQADDESNLGSISADGRCVVFASDASNLVTGDTNGDKDIFVHDRQTSLTDRISVDSSGTQANGDSEYSSISANGRYVAFTSDASNLVVGDTNGDIDIFVYDRQTGLTERVSVDPAGTQANNTSYEPSISADGRSVAFDSDASNLVAGDTNGGHDIFVNAPSFAIPQRYVVPLGPGETISGMDFGNYQLASISGQKFNDLDGDGEKEAGEPGLDGWTIELVDTSSGVVVETAVTAGGGLYSFEDFVPGDYEVREVLRNGWTQTHPAQGVHSVSPISGGVITGKDFGNAELASISGQKFKDLDGDGVKDAGEAGLYGWTIELVDANTGELLRSRSTSSGGLYSFVNLVAGNYKVREIPQTGWVQTLPAASVYTVSLAYGDHVTDRDFGNYPIASTITGQKFEDINANGVKDAGEPGLEGWKIYVDLDANGQWDSGEQFDLTDSSGNYEITGLSSGTYTLAEVPQIGWQRSLPDWEWLDGRVSVDSAGTQGDGNSYYPSISADGRYVAFRSEASNLVADDTNGKWDIFVHDRQTGLTERVSVSSAGTQGNDDSEYCSISADGRYVAFGSHASKLVVGDTNDFQDIFVHDRQTGLTELVSIRHRARIT